MNLSQVKVNTLNPLLVNALVFNSRGLIVWSKQERAALDSLKQNFDTATSHVAVVSAFNFQNIEGLKHEIQVARSENKKIVVIFDNISQSCLKFADFVSQAFVNRKLSDLQFDTSDSFIAVGSANNSGESINGMFSPLILNQLSHLLLVHETDSLKVAIS